MKRKIRDYSKATIDAFEKYIDTYYDAQSGGIRSNWDKIKRWFGIYPKKQDEINGNVEKYIRSLEDNKSVTVNKIKRTWEAVAAVEETYSADFQKVSSMCENYVSAARKAADIINISSFSNPVSVGGLLNNCADEYMKLIETKLERILEKSVEDLTDQDIEILAYVSLNTTNRELKERILNVFYTDTTDQHITYVGGKPDHQPFHYYDRNKEKWEKFVTCENAYYSTYYSKYLKGELDDSAFNNNIKNHMAIQYLDEEGEMLFSSDGTGAVTIGKSDEISYIVPQKKQVQLFDQHRRPWNSNSAYAGRWDPNSPYYQSVYKEVSAQIPREAKQHLSEMDIRNGEDARREIEAQKDDKLYKSSSADWVSIGETSYKIAGKVVDHFLPGTGEIFDTLNKYGYKPAKKAAKIMNGVTGYMETNSSTHEPDYIKTAYGWYVHEFEVKCITVDGSYVLIPTKDTYDKINAKLQEVKAKDYEKYDLLMQGRPDDQTEAEWFFEQSYTHPECMYEYFH